ncbi:NitT/TauT family transport system ATP-binding protein [Tistlia consotensis]|uniref:NitT/TauT family transport system ATP-binding protein n=1 Tax=Tistlia consotensis USBA 355 TaxID=560819 RepID=A0A1Y6CF41_9PROT|nr:ATP-binding cassette domain-containing protein [Tistlia consotensis]SMF60017.1 NitT/TauT family transport system ATP-binding protein [Tistlia consotensis USBA 355]SNR94120.1 NitT/TauT family transport system ATP-binding protein [Tistlia consotensis]
MSDLAVRVALKRYDAVAEAPAHVALRDLALTVRHGELVCLLGPSGCGKSTLLNIVAGLDERFEGSLSLPRSADDRPPAIGYVFQEPRLLPWRTVRRNVELAMDPARHGAGLVEELLAAAGLAGFAEAYPQRLSLGMTRRVALVRAFAVEPDLLLMDEPFVSLDAPTAQQLRRLLLEIWQRRPTTVLFVTHDLREAIQLGDRILLFSPPPGRVVADIPVAIPRDARDEAAVEAFRRRLIDERPGDFRGL